MWFIFGRIIQPSIMYTTVNLLNDRADQVLKYVSLWHSIQQLAFCYSLMATITPVARDWSVSTIERTLDNNYKMISEIPPNLSDVISIAPGGYHCVALCQDGKVVAWGCNSYGQLDLPEFAGGVAAVCSGRNHSLALMKTGLVVAWGLNRFGQSAVPDHLNDVVMVAAGRNHSLAMRSNGTVVAWGQNQFKQCSVPLQLARVVNIYAGEYNSVALKSDGTIVQWGGIGLPQTPPVVASA